MTDTVRTVHAGLAKETADWVRRSLDDMVKIESLGDDATHVLDTLKEGKQPRLAILEMTIKDEVLHRLAAALKVEGVALIMVGKSKDADLILRALRAGASEYVVLGEDEDLRRAARSLISPQRDARLGRVTTVFPSKGGVGSTVLACNLAGELTRLGLRTVLVDLDLQFGDVLSFLDLPGGYSIADVIANFRRLDRELLDSSVSRHKSGTFVLSQSEKLEEAENIRAEDVQGMLQFLRRNYDHVIVDGVRGFDDRALATLDTSDEILLVLTQDVPSVRNAQRCMQLFGRLKYDETKVAFVLNRYHPRDKIDVNVVAESTGRAVSATIANDFAAIINAINKGVMLADVAPRAPVTRDIGAVAMMVSGVEAPKRKARAGLFARG